MTMADRPIPFREPLHASIDEALIEKLVRTFYEKIRADAELGPIFAGVITGDWEPHLQKMFAFWSSLTMLTGRYKGQPMVAHMKLKMVESQHFDRWLSLFRETANEICPPPAAAIFVDKAERVAESLKLGLFFKPEEAVAKKATPPPPSS
jgi:hemoglobin